MTLKRSLVSIIGVLLLVNLIVPILGQQQHAKLITSDGNWIENNTFKNNNAFTIFYDNIPFDTLELRHYAFPYIHSGYLLFCFF